jgi:hypothetical protein
MVPPLTPGMMLEIPISKPLKKVYIKVIFEFILNSPFNAFYGHKITLSPQRIVYHKREKMKLKNS